MYVFLCVLFFLGAQAEPLVLYNFEDAPVNNEWFPSSQASFISGQAFTANKNLIHDNFLCDSGSNCAQMTETSIGDYVVFGITTSATIDVTTLSFWHGNSDCNEDGTFVCAEALHFHMEFATTSSFSDAIPLGTFAPITGNLDAQQYNIPVGRRFTPGDYFFRISSIRNTYIEGAVYVWDSVSLIGSQVGVTCAGQWECMDVSEDYNFVSCVDSTCQCKDGFQGSATDSDKCRCSAPNLLGYEQGVAKCLTPGECLGNQHYQCASVTEQYSFVRCDDGCKCKTELGFVPSVPSVNDKCRCEGSITWVEGVPHCQ